MSDLRDLYQEVIFDHNRNPRNFGPLEGATHQANGFNPLCGDKLTVFLKVGDAGSIEDVSFQGAGCAISMASASLMTEALKGKPLDEAEKMFQGFHGLIMDKPVTGAELGKLMVLEGVKEFPSRVKCATLSWHTMHAALERKGDAVTTE